MRQNILPCFYMEKHPGVRKFYRNSKTSPKYILKVYSDLMQMFVKFISFLSLMAFKRYFSFVWTISTN